MKRNMLKILSKTVLIMTLLVIAVAYNKNYAKAADASITAVTMKTGDESFTEDTYTGKVIAIQDNFEMRSVIEVKVDCSGLLSFYYLGNNSDTVSFGLFSDEACTMPIAYSSLPASSEVEMTDSFTVSKAGTYYLELKYYEEVDIDYTMVAEIYSADDDTLYNNKSRYVSLAGYDDSNYYKIALSKAGIIKVYTTYADETECYADVDIYKKVDGKMKLLSEGDATKEGTVTGLEKGTYYIKLSNGGANFYSIRYKYTPLTDKSGAKKAKAGTIKLGTTSKGLILVSDKTSKVDWYKVKTTKNKVTTIKFSGDVTGNVTLEFYGADGDLFGSLNISSYTKEDSGAPYIGSYSDTSGKLPKGTYYIKVIKDSSNVSGSYSILIK